MRKRKSIRNTGTAAKRKRITQAVIFRFVRTRDVWAFAQEIPQIPEWVTVQANVPGFGTVRADYIWSDEDSGASNFATRRIFRIPKGFRVERAVLLLSVDNYARVFINGRIIVFDPPNQNVTNFSVGRRIRIDPSIFRTGPGKRNSITIRAVNFPFPSRRTPANPAGVAALLLFRLRRI